uniref:Receptor expression-enhancing protein n=1 Tax=Caenorhabditis tropicalis TaxID=1561998 RepID=A0A1I7V0H5_9PELO
MSDNYLEWIESRIHDKKHFTARYLAHLSDLSRIEVTTLASIICGILFIILTFCDQAHFFANSILIGIPFLLVFCFPEEKPNEESLYIYFPIFGAITLFDRNLEWIPFYYVLKMVLFLCFFMPPFTFYQRIYEVLSKDPQQENTIECRSSQLKSVSTAREISTKTALSNTLNSPKSPLITSSRRNANDIKTDVTQRTDVSSPMKTPSTPKNSDVKVTIIEEYYREEELLSPNGSVIERVVSGPFRKETTTTEKKKYK